VRGMAVSWNRGEHDADTPWVVWLPEPTGHLDPEDAIAAWCAERRRQEPEAA